MYLQLSGLKPWYICKFIYPIIGKLWNDLSPDIKSLQSLSLFKSKILQTFNASKVPSWYFVGDIKLSVLHIRLRNKCSDLNFDLFTNHVKNSASCICGHLVEDAEHFFFQCAKYINQRLQLFRDLQHIHPLNLNILLFDSSQHTNEVNTHIFVCTQEFIKNSKRIDRTS